MYNFSLIVCRSILKDPRKEKSLIKRLWGCAVHVDDTRPTKKRLACVFNMILTLDFVKGKLFKEFKSSEAVNGENILDTRCEKPQKE